MPCIYTGSGQNHGKLATYSPVDGDDDGNYTFGAVVYWRPSVVGNFVYSSGTWAVTAK